MDTSKTFQIGIPWVTGADFRAGRFAREIGFVIHAADVAAAF
jgi:hypothetical protein